VAVENGLVSAIEEGIARAAAAQSPSEAALK